MSSKDLILPRTLVAAPPGAVAWLTENNESWRIDLGDSAVC
ncbi:hypothetical protein [Rouxiella silvae]|nr:hypothetical protein [Rouxiella silvae]